MIGERRMAQDALFQPFNLARQSQPAQDGGDPGRGRFDAALPKVKSGPDPALARAVVNARLGTRSKLAPQPRPEESAMWSPMAHFSFAVEQRFRWSYWSVSFPLDKPCLSNTLTK